MAGGRVLGGTVVVIGRATAVGLLARSKRLGRMAASLIEPSADRLAIAPQDLRTADPTIAPDIYAGRFGFAGRLVETHGHSPFEVEAPSEEWARALHGFGWLRHLRAAETATARTNARALVDDWIRHERRLDPIARDPGVAARRLLAFLAQSPMLIEGCDPDFYRRYMGVITRHVRLLRSRYDEAEPGLPRLTAAIALLAAAVAVVNFKRLLPSVSRRLDAELARQIHADGGHVSRQPRAVLDILTDLLPVRQAQAARGMPVSREVMAAVDRMMHMLRFFRHGDGTLALFNGTGATPLDQIATVLHHDDALGRPPGNAPHSGFQRLEADRTVVIMDCGAPPPPPYSRTAHAGCLSFELSSGINRFVVNCGTPSRAADAWRRIARSTAAHSTVTIGERSSAVFATGFAQRWLGSVILRGPTDPFVDRQEHDGDVAVISTHDGYLEAFGLLHERTLRLSAGGERLDGRDRIVAAEGAAVGAVDFAVRFHLHPAVKVSALPSGSAIVMAPDGESWEFHPDGATAVVEESVFLADPHGPRRSLQLVLAGTAPAEIRWTFRRASPSRAERRR